MNLLDKNIRPNTASGRGRHTQLISASTTSNWSTTEADIDRSADAIVSCYRGDRAEALPIREGTDAAP